MRNFHAAAAPTSGLYFTLNGLVHLPEDTVLITAIGVSGTDADSSLVCVTSNVNMDCCRGIDGGSVGEWHFPNGTMVPRNSAAPSANFTRSGSNHEVRLNRRNGAMSPTGIYECRVPDSGAANASDVTAQITVGEQTCGVTLGMHDVVNTTSSHHQHHSYTRLGLGGVILLLG